MSPLKGRKIGPHGTDGSAESSEGLLRRWFCCQRLSLTASLARFAENSDTEPTRSRLRKATSPRRKAPEQDPNDVKFGPPQCRQTLRIENFVERMTQSEKVKAPPLCMRALQCSTRWVPGSDSWTWFCLPQLPVEAQHPSRFSIRAACKIFAKGC